MSNNLNDAILSIKRYLSGKSEVLLVYLFGSAAKNPSQAKDIDIAVLLSEEAFRKEDPSDPQIKLEVELYKLLRKEQLKIEVDVVVLNNAPVILRHEVLKYGKLLYQRDEAIRIEFEAKSEIEFYDFQPYRRLFWEALVKRIEEGKFGERSEVALD